MLILKQFLTSRGIPLKAHFHFISYCKLYSLSKVYHQSVVCLISVIKLAEHGHTTLDPVLRALACRQDHGNDKIGRVACGRKGALSFTGLVERTNIQFLRLIDVLLFSWGEKQGGKDIKKIGKREGIVIREHIYLHMYLQYLV